MHELAFQRKRAGCGEGRRRTRNARRRVDSRTRGNDDRLWPVWFPPHLGGFPSFPRKRESAGEGERGRGREPARRV